MYNKIILVGRLGTDPDRKTFQNGSSVVNFSIATSKSWKDKASGEWKEYTTWHRVIVAGVTGDYVERNLRKGDLIVVEGEQDNRSYQDQNGETKYISEVKVGFGGSITRLVANKDKESPSNAQHNPQESGMRKKDQDFIDNLPPPDGDLPF